MTVCTHAGLSVYASPDLPEAEEFLAQCVCGRMVTVTNGRIEWHTTTPEED